VGRVLLVNATGLGDLLFSTPAVRALKETYPGWRLNALVQPHFAPLVQANPYLERLWLYPGRGWRLLHLARQLRHEHYDAAIILHGNDPEATWLAVTTGAPFVIGSANSPLAFAYSAAVAPADPFEHAIERRLAYVRLLGADTPRRNMDLFLPPGEAEQAQAILRAHFGAPLPLLLALHPTGSDPYKWWPQESFAALGTFLYETYGAGLLIISGAKDRPAAAALAARLPGPSLITGGRYGLLTVAALLQHCHLLVANDSGPMHMALALGVPTLALIGADHPARIGPYQVDWGTWLHKRQEVCERSPCLLRHCPENVCLQAISVAEVTQRLRDWWEPGFLPRLEG
jgi:ADP-heptose:LPS heptosyltransferase